VISQRWQRRALKNNDEQKAPGVLTRVGSRVRSTVSSLMFESIHPGAIHLPEERHDNGPFGRVGPNTANAIKHGAGAIGRTAASPLGALVTVTVADEHIRVLTARGNRVRGWAESELPAGVVQLGLIVDEQTFIDVLGDVLMQVTRNGKLNGQKVAVAITGRNMVQRRLTVFVEDDQDLTEAIVNASSESMSIRPEEMQIEWNAEEFDLVTEDEESDDEFEDDDEHDFEESEDVEQLLETESHVAEAPVATDDLGLENLDLDLAPDPDGEPYDVYALALHKHVIRRNLRTVSEFSSRFAGVQPKILALAAAVNSRAAVVVDIEASTMITSVVSNGLPEVIREVGLSRNMSHSEWVEMVRSQISRAVAFYDSLFPEEPLGTDIDVFVTGQPELARGAIDVALEATPYVRSELPQTLRAPEDFSFEKYAANVGLVLVSGKHFWQRAPVALLTTPRFDYRPKQYRPRPLPIRAVLNIAAALILSFGVFTSFGLFTAQNESLATSERMLGVLEKRIELRTQKLVNVREARMALNSAKLKTERLIAANDVIQDRAAGFADTIAIIVGAAPEGVMITTLDDDGRIVAVEAEAADYPVLLAYIKLLEDVPQFMRVQVLNLGQVESDDSNSSLEPVEQAGGPAEVESIIAMSVKITRIKIADSELIEREELAAIGGTP
jgi:hypothetical protein